MRLVKATLLAGCAAATLLLAGCESTEEKAQRNYESAVELAAKGDTDRAEVVLRNVFKLNGEHHDARMLYAALMEQKGDFDQAFRHYALVVEQYPEEIEARIKMARIAIRGGSWDAASAVVDAARKIAPDNPDLVPLTIALDYSTATRRTDKDAAQAAVTKAQALLAADPGNYFGQQVVIDNLVREQKFSAALDQVDKALASDPKNLQFNQIKLSLLGQLQDMPGIGDQLRYMVETFPDDAEIRTSLVRWYLANNDPDGAESFVRSLVAKGGEAIPPRLALVQFLNQVRGMDVALAELDKLIAEGLDNDTFRVLKASMLFDKGDRQTGIVQIEELIAAQEPSEARRNMQTTLARMYIADGQVDKARALVESVLAEDAGDVNALKIKANWLIDQDQVRDAVLALRTALDQAPRDPETITLLARAYERGGNRELMVESLALAVDVSNAAPDETLRYSRYLIDNEKYLTAENVILRALRLDPGNIQLLQALSEVYLGMNDLPRAEQVATALRAMDTDQSRLLATAIQATVLQRSARTDESIQLMQTMVDEGQSKLAAQTVIIRTRLANGEVGEARAYMNELLAETPADSPDRTGIEFLNGALTATEGNYDGAKQIYRDILARDNSLEQVWRALVSTAVRQGNDAEAEAIVDESLVVLPDSANLRWIKAGLAEKNGRIDEAISIYEAVYAEDTSSTIIANNLASLISTHRSDDESLQRAYVIARRLRGLEIPAFQDTYGWISFRMGNQQEALENLEPAAAGLPNDPSVQYHLAKVYLAAGRTEEAAAKLQAAVDLWEGSTIPLAETARAELAAMSATPAAAPASSGTPAAPTAPAAPEAAPAAATPAAPAASQ